MMDQLNHLIDTTFSDVEKFESSNHCRYTLQSLYTASWPTKDTAPYPAFRRPKIEGHSEYRNICHKITLATPVKAHRSFMRRIL